MSNAIRKQTFRAGALVATLALSPLIFATPAAACWWGWTCYVPEPEPVPEPTYEARYKIEDCPYSWWHGTYDSECAARAEASKKAAAILRDYATKSKTSEPQGWSNQEWNNIFNQSWSGETMPSLVPLSFKDNEVDFVISPLVWDGERAQVTSVSISQDTLDFIQLQFSLRPKDIQFLIKEVTSLVKNNNAMHADGKTLVSTADIIITLAWLSSDKEKWLEFIKLTGNDLVLVSNVSSTTKLDKIKEYLVDALAAYAETPMLEIPGLAVGVVEGGGNDIETFAELGSNMFYVMRAFLSPLPKIFYDPFDNDYYREAVAYFTNMKDGVYDMLTTNPWTVAQDWYQTQKDKINAAIAIRNSFVLGRLEGNIAYSIISLFTPKGALNVAKLSKVTKIKKFSCKGKSCNKKSTKKRICGALGNRAKRNKRDFKIFAKKYGKKVGFNTRSNISNSKDCKVWKAFEKGKTVPGGLVAIGSLSTNNDEVGTVPSTGISTILDHPQYKAWLLGTARRGTKDRRYYRTVASRCGTDKAKGTALATMLKTASKYKPVPNSDFLAK